MGIRKVESRTACLFYLELLEALQNDIVSLVSHLNLEVKDDKPKHQKAEISSNKVKLASMNQDIKVDLKKSQEAIEKYKMYRKRKYRNGNENMYKGS